MDYIGSRISLVSKSDIRYVGLLHEINGEESTIALQQVRSYGTEGRRGDPANEIPASDNIFEYIVFRGSDVKDLRIEEQNAPKPPQPQPQVPDDPAILGTSANIQSSTAPPRGPPGPAGYANPNMPPQFGGPQPGYMPYYHQQPGPPMQGYGRPGPRPNGPMNDGYSMQAPPPEPKKQEELQRTKPVRQPQILQKAKPTQTPQILQQAEATQLPFVRNPGTKTAPAPAQPPTPVRSSVIPAVPMPAQKRAPAPIPAPAPPQTSSPAPAPARAGRNIKPRTDLADRQPPPPAEIANGHFPHQRQASLHKDDTFEPRGPNVDGIAFKMGGLTTSEYTRMSEISRTSNATRTHPPRPSKTVPREDYNFDEANSKFKKEEISRPEEDGDGQQDLIPPAEVAYNPGRSFFDNISSGNREGEQEGSRGGAEWRSAERSLNYETFGEARVARGRGRGGRGRGRGRGRYGRGSRGRGPSTMLEQDV